MNYELSFEPLFLKSSAPSHEKLPELIQWGRVLSARGMCPPYGKGSHGNMSVRTSQGFLITATQTDLGNLTARDFVEVLSVENKRDKPVAQCIGLRVPSSDTLIHSGIYQARSDIRAILHGHDKMVLKHHVSMAVPSTEHERESGSLELLVEIRKVMVHDYFVVKSHGILALGRTLAQAGELVLSYHHKALGFDKKNS